MGILCSGLKKLTVSDRDEVCAQNLKPILASAGSGLQQKAVDSELLPPVKASLMQSLLTVPVVDGSRKKEDSALKTASAELCSKTVGDVSFFASFMDANEGIVVCS